MRCDNWVVAECGANPFDPLCGDSGYNPARTTACLGGDIDNNPNVADRCPNLIDIHCTASPFDVSAEANGKCTDMKYNTARETFIENCQMDVPTVIGCDTAKISATSTETVAKCIENPFLTGCSDSSGAPLPILSDAVITHCTKDANIFQMGCNDHVGNARTDLVARCVPSESTTPTADCSTIIVSGGISVSQCIEDPFLPECGITEFARFATGKCVADADNSLGRLFSPLCPDSNLLELRRNSYCRASNNLFKMNCDGRGSVDATRVDAVATCIAFGLDDPGCGKDRKLSDADNALTLGGCIENPYHADCRDAVFDPARPLVVTKCFDSRNNPIAVAECDTVVANGRTVAQCISDPFHLDCADAGFADAKIARDTLCKAKKDYFDPLCDAYTDITTTRANFVNDCIAIAKPARAMDADCAAFVNACLDNPYPTDEQGTPTLLCEYPAAFAGARLTHCGKDKNVETVSQCGDLDTANSGCITDPFDASCGSAYSEFRQSRRDYCNALGSPTAAEAEANNFCTKAIVDVCANPFGPICGVAYDPERLRRCRNEIATAMACVDTIKLVCTGRTGDNPFTANPFDELCYRDDNVAEDALIYQADRVTFANKCNDDVTVPSSESAGVDCSIAKPFICTGAGEVANPFAAICLDKEAGALAELKRIKCLEIDDFRSECSGIVAGSDVDSKVWQYRAVSVDDKGNDEPNDDTYDSLIVLTEPSENDPTANFLLSGATQQQLLAGKLHSVSPVETLNLATGGGDDLGGLDTDGVFVFNGTVDSVNKLYAGLLPNVNLGAKLAMPADGTPTTAVWIGRVVLQTFAGVSAGVADVYRSLANDFALSIDYTNSRISSTTEVSLDTDTTTLATLAIDGGFNELGVIFGTTMLTVGGSGDSGLLAGLIGMKSDGSVKSALGAFHSDTTPAARAYAGGFVASNKICTDNVFADGCDKDPTTHVMRETRCGISGDGDGVLINGECAPTLARLCDADGDISAPFAPSAGASGYVCKDDPTFRPQREVVCAKEQMDNPTVALTAQCMPVVMISCMDNPLNRELCYHTDNTYIEARGLACIDDIKDTGAERAECNYEEMGETKNAITVFCATPDGMTNSATNGCDATAEMTRTTCAADPFNEDCLTSVTSDTYAQLRLNKCIAAAFGMTDTVDSTCSTLVDTYCTNNPFANNVHCTDGTTYDTPRITRAHKCYNPANRDTEECNNIKGCLNPANLFSDSAQFGGIACNNTLLQGVRVRYCSEGDNIETNENCVTLGNDTNSCTFNPFSNCAGVLDGALLTEVQTNRINYCFKGGNGENGGTCLHATFAESCILNPFADSCTDKYADQRQQRVDYCLDITASRSPVCNPARVVVCVADPNNTNDFDDVFAPLCRRIAYLDERAEVAMLCLGDSPPTTCNRIATCLKDPYMANTDSTLCEDAALDSLRDARVEACKSVTDPGVICAEQAVLEVCMTNAVAFAWHCQQPDSPNFIANEVTRQKGCLGLDGITRPDGVTDARCDESILGEGSSIHALWANKALDFDGVTPLGFLRSGTERIYEDVERTLNGTQPVILLDLSEPPSGTHENSDGYRIILEGDATDGFATYQADVVSAGILVGTDLGALFVKPADDSAPTVTWYGRAGVNFNGVNYASNDFKLTIDFYAQTLDSSTSLVNVADNTDTKTLALFRAQFNKFGIIYGQINFNDTLGTLSGLIGTEGAIGTWATNQNDSTIRVSGGFVANDKTCANPFRRPCGEEHDAERLVLFNDCTALANPLADPPTTSLIDTPACANVKACIERPFTSNSDLSCAFPLFDDTRDDVCLANVAQNTAQMTDTVLDARCDDLVTAYCDNTTANDGTNLFNRGCDASYDLRRVTACYNDEEVHARCTEESIFSTYCNDGDSESGIRPFNPLCSDAQYNGGRIKACLGNETVDATCPRLISNRIAFCGGELAPNPVDDRCSGVNVCIDDPFATDDLCDFAAFDGFKTDRRTACSEPGPTVTCVNAKVHLCVGRGEYAAPFVPICSETPKIALQQRIYCYLDDTADTDCTDINEKTFAVAEVWQYSAVDTDGETPLNIVQDIGDATERANFIAGPVIADDTTLTATLGAGLGGTVTVNTLTLGDLTLGGDAEDGAFFATATVGGEDRAYAGILESINLGAPLVAPAMDSGAPTTLTWNGRVHLQIFATSAFYRDDSFDLTIDFANAVGDAIGTVSSTSTNGTITLAINGSFNKFGVIYGTTTLTRSGDNYGGVLTGLIGIEGAVGAFHTGTLVNGYVGVFVAEQDNQCLINPFADGAVGCDAEKMAKITECSLEDNITNTVLCGDTLKAQPCLSDPFNTLDDPSNTLDGCMAKTEFDTARTNRWTFCLKEGNATHSICEPVAYLCSAVGDVDVRCKTNTTGVTVAGDYCDDIANANTATCNVTVAFCADSANEGKAPCGVNTARWAKHAYVVDDKGTSVTTDDTRTEAPILETILSTSDETGFINLPEVTYDPPDEGEDPGPKQKEALEAAAATPMDVMEVNLNLLTLGNHKVGDDPAVNLLGEEEDGAFFFNGIQNARNIFYAGITATTDLGAPLVAPDGDDAPTKLTWNGRIHLYANIYGGIALRSDDFQLKIDFADGTLKSETTIIHPRDTAVVTITGKFDRFGLVYGTTTLNLNTAGMYGGLLTGLIGIEGAVGAFVSNSESSLDFAGAFVANDKVCSLQPFGDNCFKEFNEERAMIADGCSGAGLSPIPPEMLVAPIAPEIATKMAKIAECAAAKPFICVATSRNYDARFAAGEDYSNPFASLCSGIESALLVALQREACIAGTPASSDAIFPVGESCSTLITAGGVTANVWEHTAEKTDGTKLAIRKTIERVYDKTRALDPDVEDVEFWGAEQTVASVLARDEITEFAPITLNLADGGLANDGSVDPNDNLNLLGDAGDGAAFGRVTWAATDDGMPILSKKFAWILPTTDLGAELTAPSEGAPTTAIWHGRASLLISELTAEATAVEATYSFNNFELMVDFTNRTLASTGNTRDTGTTTETTTPRVNDDDFVIDLEVEGSFADGKYGLITGTTTVTTSSSGDGGSKFPLESYTGILTGLIGADGAVGAFISDHGRQDYEYVGAFVASDKICTNDPFHARCLDQFDDTRTELIKNCTGASPDLVKCAVVKERICRLSGEDANPFAELCEGEGTEADVREANDRRQEACLQDASAWEAKYEGLVCTDHIKTGGASANLWTYTAKKTDGMTDLTIRETIERTYDTNDSKTDFWVADKTAMELLTISNLDTTPNSNLAGAPDFNRLDLDDTYDDPRGTGRTIGFGGDAEDGAISFRAEWRDGGTTTIKYFAGILPTTNLGTQVTLVAPSASGAVTTGYWHGRVVFQGFDTIYKTDDLELEIDFASDMRKITARPELLNNVNGNAGTLRIDGKFDENGLITGTTDFRATGSVNTARTGILTGLIGVEGAVAAFISDSDTDYAGVFVANDNVCGQNPFDVLCGADFKEQRNQVVINCSVESPDIAACANAEPFICVTTRSNYNTEYNPDQFAAEEDYTNPFVKLCEGDGTEDALRQAKVLRQLACLIDTEESERARSGH